MCENTVICALCMGLLLKCVTLCLSPMSFLDVPSSSDRLGVTLGHPSCVTSSLWDSSAIGMLPLCQSPPTTILGQKGTLKCTSYSIEQKGGRNPVEGTPLTLQQNANTKG